MNKHPNESKFSDNKDELNTSVDKDTAPYDQDRNNNTRWLAGATVVMFALVTGTAVYATNAINAKNTKIEAKNSLNEGQLRERGFDDSDIFIDVSGDTNVITIGCPGTVLDSTDEDRKSISFIYNSETMTASWDVAPQMDQGGQVVDTFPAIEFPLSTEFEVINFINDDLVKACNAVESN